MVSNNTLNNNSSNQYLISLAFLEASISDGQSHLDRLKLFEPIINESLRSFNGSIFSTADLRDEIQRNFGLDLPAHVLHKLLGRYVGKGYLVKDGDRYEATEKKLPYSNYGAKKKEATDKYDELVSALLDYSRCHNIGLYSKSSISNLLQEYLIECFGTTDRSVVANQEMKDKDQYRWLNRFFLDSDKHNPGYINTAVSMMKGQIVYDAVFFAGLDDSAPSYRGVRVYLDSPIVCNALGFSTEANERYTLDAIETLRNSGASIRVFDDTVNEIQGILDAIIRNWGGLDYGGLDSYGYCFKKRGMTKEDIIEIRGLLDEIIEERLKIRIETRPQRKKEYVAEESKLMDRLRDSSQSGTVTDLSPRVMHDVNCIAAILSIRKGKRPDHLSASEAIFACDSYLTIRNSLLWWRKDEQRKDFPPILSLRDLVSFAWLSNPSKYGSAVRDELVATCATAILPSNEVWTRFVDRLSVLIEKKEMTEAQAQVIIQKSDIASILDDTIGIADLPDEVSDQAYDAVIAKAKDEIAEEALSKERDKAARAISELEQSRDEKAREVEKQEKENEALLLSEKQLRMRLLKLSNTISKVIAWTIIVLLIVVLFVVGTQLISGICPDGSMTVANTALIIIAIATLIGLRRQAKRLSSWFEIKIMHSLYPDGIE